MSYLKKILLAVILAVQGAHPGFAAKTLTFCSQGSPKGFNPQLYIDDVTFDASSRQIYNRLVEFERRTTTIRPALAERWDVSDDGKEYTLSLRKGVKFHTTEEFSPSRDFNADDVLFSFGRQRDKDHPYHLVSGGTYEYFNGMIMQSLITDIQKIDDTTVRFVLSRPEAPFLANIAMDFASILSAEYADQLAETGNQENLDEKPIGTGPFQLVSYQKDTEIRYRAHPDYWQGKTPLDYLVFVIEPDASVRYAKLKAGDCHVMANPKLEDVKRMRNDVNVQLLMKEDLNVGYLAFNTEKKPFDNVLVRQALNMAIDKQAIIDTIFQGGAKKAKNPIPPTVWSYNDGVQDYPYDPDKAKQMLVKAGYESGFATTIWALPVQRLYNPDGRRMAELIQADWEKVGVKAEIVFYDWSEYLRRSKDGAHQSILLGWTGDNGDPDNFLAVLLSCDTVGGANRARWCYPPFEELIKKAKTVIDFEERTRLYKKAQVIFKEQAPWVPIAHSMTFTPVRKNVINFRLDPFGGHIFYGVDLQ